MMACRGCGACLGGCARGWNVSRPCHLIGCPRGRGCFPSGGVSPLLVVWCFLVVRGAALLVGRVFGTLLGPGTTGPAPCLRWGVWLVPVGGLLQVAAHVFVCGEGGGRCCLRTV